VAAGAVDLEASQFVQGAVETALDAGLVAGKELEAASVLRGHIPEAQAVARVVEIGLDHFGSVGEAEFDVAGGHEADAAQAPGSGDDLLYQQVLGGSDGLMLGFESGASFVEFIFIFVGQDDGLGGEPVAQGVEADGGASGIGFGTGAFLSIFAIGSGLFFGGH
jgi:hypothetical protein